MVACDGHTIIFTNEQKMILTTERINELHEHFKITGLSKSTIDMYMIWAKHYHGAMVDQQFLKEELLKDKKVHQPQRAFLNHVIDFYGLKIKIPIQRGRKETKPVHYFTKEEIELLIRDCDDERVRLSIILMFELGLRVSEVTNLQKRCLDPVNLRLKGKGKGNKWFDLPLKEQTAKHLFFFFYKYKPDDYPFRWEGVKHQRNKLWYEIKKLGELVLPYKNSSEIHPHAFRHSTGTYLKKIGLDLLDIRDFLRHKEISTVQHYASADIARVEKTWTNFLGGKKDE